MIEGAVAAGAKGIVHAATGAGYPIPAEEVALARAGAAGLTVCISSTVGGGRVVRSPQMIRNRFVAAGNLAPWKARILLALALKIIGDAIQAMFDRY